MRVCYIAYAMLSLLDYRCRKLGYNVLEVLEKLKTGYKVYMRESSGQSWESSVVLEKKLADFLRKFGVVYK